MWTKLSKCKFKGGIILDEFINYIGLNETNVTYVTQSKTEIIFKGLYLKSICKFNHRFYNFLRFYNLLNLYF